MNNIKQYLENNILLFDGAMGTLFASLHDDPFYKCEYANITHASTIKEIHTQYLKAGAKAIKTNTFSLFDMTGNERFSYQEIIQSAYQIATETAKDFDAFVFCDIGMIQATDDIPIFEKYQAVIDEFLKLGAKHFLFETFAEIDILNELSQYIKSKESEAFIIASLALTPEGFTKTGQIGSLLLSEADSSIDAIGLNCNCGPHYMKIQIPKLSNIPNTKQYLSIMPNASYPTVLGNRVQYNQNASYFAKQMLEMIHLGAKIIGGCCGTTPEFIKAMHTEIQNNLCKTAPSITQPEAKDSTPIEKSEFYEKLLSNHKPIAVELDPPFDSDITKFMDGAKALKECGVDLVTIADCPVARVRMDSSLLACKLKRELDLPTIPHMTCRDRNINASKALLLGLNMEKINDILIITGDPIPTEQRNEIKAVYEFNSRMLLKHISGLNQTFFSSPFYLYAALNINAHNFSVQLRLAKQKVANGAVGFFTQPVLSKKGLDNLKIAKEELGVPIVGGIFPVISYRNANFLKNEIPGIDVCDEILELYYEKSPEECRELAVKISTEIAKEMHDYIDGYYLITPLMKVDIITDIMKNIQNIQTNPQ